MKFYYPTNPRTTKQQAWRAVFRTGKATWDALAPQTKTKYNKRAYAYKFTGFNLFMREYLAKNRI